MLQSTVDTPVSLGAVSQFNDIGCSTLSKRFGGFESVNTCVWVSQTLVRTVFFAVRVAQSARLAPPMKPAPDLNRLLLRYNHPLLNH